MAEGADWLSGFVGVPCGIHSHVGAGFKPARVVPDVALNEAGLSRPNTPCAVEHMGRRGTTPSKYPLSLLEAPMTGEGRRLRTGRDRNDFHSRGIGDQRWVGRNSGLTHNPGRRGEGDRNAERGRSEENGAGNLVVAIEFRCL
jgi:hypothetical protein